MVGVVTHAFVQVSVDSVCASFSPPVHVQSGRGS